MHFTWEDLKQLSLKDSGFETKFCLYHSSCHGLIFFITRVAKHSLYALASVMAFKTRYQRYMFIHLHFCDNI